MKSIVATSAVLLFALQCYATYTFGGRLTPEKLERAITTQGLQRNLYYLDKIGRQNGGNRAFGTAGYKESSRYLLDQITSRFDTDFVTWTQKFNHTYEETRKISLTGPGGENVEVISLMYNSATPIPNGVTGQLVQVPVDDSRGSGCFEDQWTGIDVSGKLALIKRGVCSISDKLKLAKTHGALGVVLFHNVEGTPSAATLGAANIGLLAPAGLIRLDVGEAWRTRLAAGEQLTVTLIVDSSVEQRETWNVLAETRQGDPNNVIMLGAHLDSVQAGSGINDDGSGVTAQIEILQALRGYTGIKNKIRFAWWGAEEAGLVGSLYYTSKLTEKEADRIRFYFNYDMIGSPVPVYGIYVGENPGDKVGAQLLLDYLVAKGKPAYFGSFGTGSDYVGFLNLGIPSSGIHTGGGIPTDPCYHLSCDTYDNISWDALNVNTKAAAVAAATFALSVKDLPRRNKTTINPRSERHVRDQFSTWQMAALEAAEGHTCAHKSKLTL